MQDKISNSSYNILSIITGCGGGDWPPLLALAEGLAGAGHDLVVVCDKSTLQAVKSCGLQTLCLSHPLELVQIFQPALSRLLSRDEKLLHGSENPLKEWGEISADTILSALGDWVPSLIITSLLGVGLGERLSKSLSTPWCFLNPSFYFGDSPDYLWGDDFSQLGVHMYKSWVWPHVRTADLVLHATDQVFDTCCVVLPDHHQHIGPLFWEQPVSDQELPLLQGLPWVLIAVSTSPQPGDLTIVKTALKTLGSMELRVLVTLSPGHQQDDLGRIPANVHVTGYMPHSKILPHCCLVISHSGHGIVMKSMAYGVPMVLVPWGRDQPGVAGRANRLGTAVVVPRSECSVRALAEAIKDVFTHPVYLQRSQEVSARLGNSDGCAKAVDSIERFLGKMMAS